MTNKTYDILKFIATIVLPALGTLYFALAQIWGFPYGEEIIGTITAIVTFLATILKVSSVQYYKAEEPFNPEALDELMSGKGEK